MVKTALKSKTAHCITIAAALMLIIAMMCAPFAQAASLGAQSAAIEVGSKVKIARGATDYNGNKISRAFYYFDFTVDAINGDKASLSKTVTLAEVKAMGISIPSSAESLLSGAGISSYTVELDVNTNDLYLASEEAPEDTVTDFESYKKIQPGSRVYIYEPVDYEGKEISVFNTFVDVYVTAIDGDKATVSRKLTLTEIINEVGIEIPEKYKDLLPLADSMFPAVTINKDVKLDNLILVSGGTDENVSYKKGTYKATEMLDGYDRAPTTTDNYTKVLSINPNEMVVITDTKGKWGKTEINGQVAYFDMSRLELITEDYLLFSEMISIGSTVNITESTRIYGDSGTYAVDYLQKEYTDLSKEQILEMPFKVMGDKKSYGDRVYITYTDLDKRLYVFVEVPVSQVELCIGTYTAKSANVKLYSEMSDAAIIKKVFSKGDRIVVDSVKNGWGHTFIDRLEGYVRLSDLNFKTGELELFTEEIKLGDKVKLKSGAKTYFGGSIIEELTAKTNGQQTITEQILFQQEMTIIKAYSDYLELYFTSGNGMAYDFAVSIDDVVLKSTVDGRNVYGDINGDNTLSMLDITEYQRVIASLATMSQKALTLADVDGDGSRNLVDVTLMQKKMAGLISKFPVENVLK